MPINPEKGGRLRKMNGGREKEKRRVNKMERKGRGKKERWIGQCMETGKERNGMKRGKKRRKQGGGEEKEQHKNQQQQRQRSHSGSIDSGSNNRSSRRRRRREKMKNMLLFYCKYKTHLIGSERQQHRVILSV